MRDMRCEDDDGYGHDGYGEIYTDHRYRRSTLMDVHFQNVMPDPQESDAPDFDEYGNPR